MYRRGLLATVAAGMSLAGCNDKEPADGTPPEDESMSDEGAEIVDHDLVRHDIGTEEATVVIEGTVRIVRADLQHVELRGQFFDKENELLDTTFERLQELDVGTQPFEIEYFDVGPETAKVDGYAVAITTII